MAREEMVKKGGPGLRELAPTARGSQRSSEVSARILKTHNGTFLRDSFEWQSRALLSSFTVAGQSEERISGMPRAFRALLKRRGGGEICICPAAPSYVASLAWPGRNSGFDFGG